ncbi:hypothetical protein GCM10009827_103950 [Dactylosporangium maewongense]|uniref:Bacterial Pleckstrin homology domain-containing protein n=1 Tax=Dactylosporangium maewongense TaxID=634393 RepID=A0ABN2CXH5_9ACTN
MATVTVTGDLIDIRFTRWERLWIGRERLTIPAAGVRRAAFVAEPLGLAHGARRGIVVSGFLKIGVWGIFGGPRQLVVARRGEAGLHLVLDRPSTGGQLDEVVLSHPAGARIADAIARVMAARA